MDDLISRQAAIDAIAKYLGRLQPPNTWETWRSTGKVILDIVPSAQPEQKIGYWIPVHPLQADDEGAYLCSNCKTGDCDIKPTDKFCKFCGAKMQGVKKV